MRGHNNETMRHPRKQNNGTSSVHECIQEIYMISRKLSEMKAIKQNIATDRKQHTNPHFL